MLLCCDCAHASAHDAETAPSLEETAPSVEDLSGVSPLSPGRYVLGGLLGIFPGFGLGHAVVGDYWGRGAVFTLLDAAGVAAIRVTARQVGDMEPRAAIGIVSLVALPFFAVRIWQIVDLWGRNHIRVRRYEKDRQRDAPSEIRWGPAEVSPWLGPRGGGLLLRLRL